MTVPWMHAERGIDAFEVPFPHEAALGAAVLAALLPGCAVHPDLAADLVHHLSQGRRGQDGGGAKEVVPTAVAEAHEGVVFGQVHEDGTGLF